MLKLGRQHKDRVWAVEGCNGIGRHIAAGMYLPTGKVGVTFLPGK
jgi:hypothetical protein